MPTNKHIILRREDFVSEKAFKKLLRELGAKEISVNVIAASVILQVESVVTTKA